MQREEHHSDDGSASDKESYVRYKQKRRAFKAKAVKEEQRRSESSRASRARSNERDHSPEHAFIRRDTSSELINTSERRRSPDRGNSGERTQTRM